MVHSNGRRWVLALAGMALSFMAQGLAQERVRGVVQYGELRPAPSRESPPSLRFSLNPARETAFSRPSAEELAPLATPRIPPLVGIHRDVRGEALAAGTWEALPDGGRLWRVSLRSSGAKSLRLWFSEFAAGTGKVWVRGEGSGDAAGPYSGAGPFEDGRFWSATVDGEVAAIEYQPDAEVTDDAVPFEVTLLSHEVESAAAMPVAGSMAVALSPAPPSDSEVTLGPLAGKDPALACNLDLNCFSQWLDSARTVGRMRFEVPEGKALCTGTLVRTRNDSGKPYFLTAGHCVETEDIARSLEIDWDFRSSKCIGGYPDSTGTVKSTGGGHLLASQGIGGGDYSLLLLSQAPSGVPFADWDPGEPQIGSIMVGIHHPRGSYKRIAFGTRTADGAVVVGSDPAAADLFYRVQWYRGVAEPGSSGSPVFTAPGMIAGMLSYGPVAADLCNLNNPEGYGKFATAYRALSDYFDDVPATNVAAAPRSVDFRGTDGALTPAKQTVSVTTASKNPVAFNIRSDAPWIRVSAASANTSAATPGTFDITTNPKMLNRTGSYVGTVTITNGSASPQFVTVRADMRIDRSSVTATATPNPVPRADPDADGAQWAFAVRLTESAGFGTKLIGVQVNGTDYTDRIGGWFGSDVIPPGGAIEARLRAANLLAPAQQYWFFTGLDQASGRTWSTTLVVNFQ